MDNRASTNISQYVFLRKKVEVKTWNKQAYEKIRQSKMYQSFIKWQ